MERPTLALWDKGFAQAMYDWCKWHVDNTDIDNRDDFVKFFMRKMNGKMNPQTIKDIWEFTKGVERMTKYHASTKNQFKRVLNDES